MIELLERLAAVFFPPACLLCGEVVAFGEELCGHCYLPLYTGDSKKAGEYYRRELYPLCYEGNIQQALLSLKKQPDKQLASFLCRLMAQEIRRFAAEGSYDLLIPVPPKRRAFGGRHNHAELLTRLLSIELGIPCRMDLIYRSPASKVQHLLSAKERRENARASYFAIEGMHLNGERVLLVDDIITTGYTADACAKCLLELGASLVDVIAAAGTQLDEKE